MGLRQRKLQGKETSNQAPRDWQGCLGLTSQTKWETDILGRERGNSRSVGKAPGVVPPTHLRPIGSSKQSSQLRPGSSHSIPVPQLLFHSA